MDVTDVLRDRMQEPGGLPATALVSLLVHAGLSAARASFPDQAEGGSRKAGVGAVPLFRLPSSVFRLVGLRGLTALLHVLQPLARLRGRQQHGLTPWRRHSAGGFALPRPRTRTLWSEHWQAPTGWLGAIEATLQTGGARVRRGGA